MNKHDNTSLSKNCSSCGLQKPLSAFLQIAGPEGATYGTICFACQKTALNKPKTAESEGGTNRETDNRIGAEERLFDATDKKLQKDLLNELYREEQEKDELNSTNKAEKTLKTAEDQKNHRQGFLGKRSFLTTETKVDRQRETEKKHKTATETLQTQNTEETIKQDKALKEEKQIKGIDMTGAFIPTPTGYQEKMQGSAEFRKFAAWLGKSAPMSSSASSVFKNMEKTTQKNPVLHNEKIVQKSDAPSENPAPKNNATNEKSLLSNSLLSDKPVQKTNTPNEKPATESLPEFVENNWGPRSRGR